MATFNLVRNSRVLFTNNVNSSTGVITTTGLLATNTYELQVLDGFTFSQATNADTVTISEAGGDPVRGQRSFNTSLNNVEFSFSTYMRPRLSTTVKAEEAVLWNALLGTEKITTAATAIGGTPTSAAFGTGDEIAQLTIGAASGLPALTVGAYYVVKGVVGSGANEYNSPVKVISSSGTSLVLAYVTKPATAPTFGNWTAASFSKTAWNEHVTVAADLNAPYSEVVTAFSNKNQLEKFGMIFTVDGVTYLVDNCAMDQASIDFGLDGIAMIAWTGKGTVLRQTATAVVYDDTTPSAPVLSGGLTGTVAGKNTTAHYITQKLATIALDAGIGGAAASPAIYNLALTGGNITIANNISYVTPANLGVVNVPIGYYTGTRAISGNVTAYLRTGTLNTAGLLKNMLDNASASVDPKFRVKIDIGGSSNAVRVELLINGAMIQIPTIDAQAVLSTTINFTAQGTDAVLDSDAVYDIENVNELRVRYFAS